MNGVLNEVTNTVHKSRGGQTEVQTTCGAVSGLSHDRVTVVAGVELAAQASEVSKCGRCFDDAGGY